MRISIRPNDPGYHNHLSARQQGYRASVRFNGEQAFGIITADADNGVLVRIAQPVKWDADRGQFVDEVLHGRVEVSLEPEMML